MKNNYIGDAKGIIVLNIEKWLRDGNFDVIPTL
jgi:hypothetical protein